jgi:hypothetical protein
MSSPRLKSVLRVGVSCLLLAFGGIFALAAMGEEPEPNAMAILIAAIDSDREIDDERVTRAFDEAVRVPASKPLAHYALAVVRIHQARFDDAMTVLNALPQRASQSPPFLRLRLWLCLQVRDQERARKTFDELLDRLKSGDISGVEAKDSSTLLASLIGMIEGEHESTVLGPERHEAARSYCESIKDSSIVAACRRHTTTNAAVSKFLKSTLDDATAVSAEANILARREIAEQVGTLTKNYNDAKLATEENNEVVKARRAELLANEKELGSKAIGTLREARKPTPGHPGRPPSPPVEPRKPSPPSPPRPASSPEDESRYRSDQSAYEREKNAYDRESGSYERDLRQYEQDVRAYPGRVKKYQADLAAWILSDRLRRESLEEHYKKAIADRKDVEAIRKDLAHETLVQQDKVRGLGEELSNQRRKLAVLDAVSAGDGEEVTQQVFVPANFELLDWDRERMRVAAAWKKVTKKLAPSK